MTSKETRATANSAADEVGENAADAVPGAKFGPVGLADGITARNFAGVLLGVFLMAACFIGTNTVQPWLLENHLGLDADSQGPVTGWLTGLGQVVTVLLAGWFGAMVDLRGTRTVLVMGVVVMGLGLLTMPHAMDVTELTIARLLFSVGRAGMAACFTVLIADYVLSTDLGKANALQGTMFGVGAMVAATVILNLPRWMVEGGIEARAAGIYTFSILGGIAMLMALTLRLMLSDQAPRAHGERRTLAKTVVRGLAEAKRPGVALAYGASFAVQACMSVIGAYLTLWTKEYGLDNGMTAAEGISAALPLLITMQLSSLALMPVFGVLTDRFGVMRGLLLAMVLGGGSYLSTGLVEDPTAWPNIVVCAVMGIAQAGMILTAQMFVQQQAPEEVRGTVVGFFSVSGALGSVIALGGGGWLFNLSPAGPFVFAGAIATLILAWALLLLPKLRASASASA